MVEPVAITGEESSGFRFSWGLAFAGGVVATAVTFFLLMLGSGFGLLLMNPVKHAGSSLPAFLTGGAIYFFAAQAFGFAVGGHIAGRLLGPQIESRLQEEFRAAAHGLVAWAITILASLAIVAAAGLAALRGGLAVAPLYGAYPAASAALSTSYVVDGLFWPDVAGAADVTNGANAAVASGERAEATRILQASLMRGEQLSPSDHDRLVYLVASAARVPIATASERVDRMQSDVQTQTRDAADKARKVASYASLWIAFSLLFGAIVAVFSAISARIEDDREAWSPFLALRRRVM
ncbi:MAG TPA: hypothetical protein VHY79_11385 [Rhizomicrobium sp.]|jgi:hypothetical protein|nr:hypothetical protein [Rhizomicrobium sp.]